MSDANGASRRFNFFDDPNCPDAAGSYTPMEKQSGYRKKASLDRDTGFFYIGRISC